MPLSPEAVTALRSTIYHRLKAWDASVEAEELLGRDIDSERLDDYLAHIDNADDALTMSEATLAEIFGL